MYMYIFRGIFLEEDISKINNSLMIGVMNIWENNICLICFNKNRNCLN